MYIFILSILVVSFISLCFFKKKFWENRYLVLLITASVAIVVTLSTNFITRNKLGTTNENIVKKEIQLISFNPSLIDSTFFISNNKDLGLSEHNYKKDSTTKPVTSHYLFYYDNGGLKLGYATNGTWRYQYLSKIYIAPSTDEKVAYYTKVKKIYNERSSKWVSSISLPRIKTIKCFYLPPSEYAAIPDSLIRKIPI